MEEEVESGELSEPVEIISSGEISKPLPRPEMDSSNDNDSPTFESTLLQKRGKPEKNRKSPEKKRGLGSKRKTFAEVSEFSQGYLTPDTLKERQRRKQKNDEEDDEDSVPLILSNSLKANLSPSAQTAAITSLSDTDKIVLSCQNNQLFADQHPSVPVKLLFPADKKYSIRTPEESAVNATVNSLISNPSGVLMQMTKFIAVLEENSAYKDDIPDIPDNIEDLIQLLQDPKRKKSESPFKLIVICGNHRLLALNSIVEKKVSKNWKLFIDVKVQCDIFYKLTDTQLVNLASVDNTIGHSVNQVTLAQQVEFIQNQWKNPDNLTKSNKLKKTVRETIIRHYIKDPKVTPTQIPPKVFNSNGPFINACKIDDTTFKTILPLLKANTLKKQLFIELMNLKNVVTIRNIAESISDIKNSSEIKLIEAQIKKIKWIDTIWQLVVDIAASQDLNTNNRIHLVKIFGSPDQIYLDYGASFFSMYKKASNVPTLQDIKDASSNLKGNKKIIQYPPAFYAYVMQKIKAYKNDIAEANYTDQNISDFDTYLKENSISKISISNACEQFFFSGNAANDIVWNKVNDIISNFKSTCPLIILDPPFSLLKNTDWDHFDLDVFKKIFNCSYSRYPDATFIIFHSDKMIQSIYSILNENNITNYTLCSYYTAGKHLSNYYSSFSYLAQYYTIATKRSDFNFTTSDQRSNTPTSAYMHTNFRVINRARKSINNQFQSVNVSEKSVILLRSIISLFAIPTQFVVDPMCGSGSVAEACTSLNISCISFDIREDQAKDSFRRINSIFKTSEKSFGEPKKYPSIDFPCNFAFSAADDADDDDEFIDDDEEYNDQDKVDTYLNILTDNPQMQEEIQSIVIKCVQCDSTANLISCISNLHLYCPSHFSESCCVPVALDPNTPSTAANTPASPPLSANIENI